MATRGVALAIMVCAGLVGSQGGAAPLFAARSSSSPVTFAADWQQACDACRAPVVADGVVYTVDSQKPGPGGGFRSTVRTFDAATGEPGWTFPLGRVSASAVAAVANGLVYVTETFPFPTLTEVIALGVATGSVRWRFGPPRPGHGREFIRDLIVDGTSAYVVDSSEKHLRMTRLDVDGRPTWTVKQTNVAGGFAIARGEVYLFSSEILHMHGRFEQVDFLTVYRESTGQRVRRFSYTGSPSEPFVGVQAAHGLVYAVQYVFGEGSGMHTVAIDPKTGAIVWTGTGTTSVAVGPDVLIDSSAFFNSSGTTELTGYDPITGALLWGPIGDAGASPAIDGNLVFTFLDDTMQARDIESGALEGTFTGPAGDRFLALTAANGHVYLAGYSHLVSVSPS